MADNYLDKKMEEYRAKGERKTPRTTQNLTRLLLKNRSVRGYDPSFVVREDQMRSILEVATRVPSAMNRQGLRFRPVLADEADKVLEGFHLGGALPELKLPFAGTEPHAFIIVCAACEPDHYLYIDLGIVAQSMLLRATEMGLNGIMMGAFDKQRLQREFNLPSLPLMLIALGKGAEKIVLTPISAEESHAYYRRDGVHYVPKVRLEELILK
ncbi:MAG: nitroreductase family protein [Alistipes sp.]|nr:nitroreductase family protein [Alistipes sp.]